MRQSPGPNEGGEPATLVTHADLGGRGRVTSRDRLGTRGRPPGYSPTAVTPGPVSRLLADFDYKVNGFRGKGRSVRTTGHWCELGVLKEKVTLFNEGSPEDRSVFLSDHSSSRRGSPSVRIDVGPVSEVGLSRGGEGNKGPVLLPHSPRRNISPWSSPVRSVNPKWGSRDLSWTPGSGPRFLNPRRRSNDRSWGRRTSRTRRTRRLPTEVPHPWRLRNC